MVNLVILFPSPKFIPVIFKNTRLLLVMRPQPRASVAAIKKLESFQIASIKKAPESNRG
jgi:hypothetical protein